MKELFLNNIWSKNKYVSLTINVLLFLLSINIFHYGQLLLPVICLIIFINKKFKFKVNNIFIFTILCLFAVSFCYFSYSNGFYCVMGFCLPMAYYIGSNVYEINEENIKKIIYILAIGMASHVVLNFAYEYFVVRGKMLFVKNGHYDIWTKSKISTTSTAVNYTYIVSIILYTLLKEKKKSIKFTCLLITVLIFVYDFGLGRRAPVIMLLVSCFLYFVIELIGNKKALKKLLTIAFVLISIVILFLLAVKNNLFGIVDKLNRFTLSQKFAWSGLDLGRLYILKEGFPLLIKNIWGGGKVSNILGIQFHDFWFDIFDYAGIVSFILIITYTAYEIKNTISLLLNKKISSYKLIIIFELCVLLQLLIEPVMTGNSIFVICSILSFAVINELNIVKF